MMAQDISLRLSEYMEKHRGPAYRVDRFPDGRSLLAGSGFDLIFLDIQMKRPDGMETARLLRQRGEHGLLVFVTVLKECVFNAFEVEAFDYLLKPLDDGHFKRTMDRAMEALAQRTAKSVVVQRGYARQVVPLSQIVYCEVQGRKIYLHQADGAVVDFYEKLDAFERQMDGRFFRCHRSYLINLDYVRSCRTGQAVLAQGGAVPVSRLRERDLTQALLRRMKERGG